VTTGSFSAPRHIAQFQRSSSVASTVPTAPESGPEPGSRSASEDIRFSKSRADHSWSARVKRDQSPRSSSKTCESIAYPMAIRG
jgi:hypothetical protein